MRKLFLASAAALAMLAGTAVNPAPAKADCSGWCVGSTGTITGTIAAATLVAVFGKMVLDDIAAGGLKRKVAYFEPGAGFTQSAAARLEANPSLRLALADYQRAYPTALAAVK